MSLDVIPINPLLSERGAFVALKDDFDEELVKPIELAEGRGKFETFDVKQDFISVQVASKLQFGSIFGGEVRYNETGFWFDAAAYTDQYIEGSLEGKIIYATRWGIGIRIALRVSDRKIDLDANFGAVAAAVEAGAAKARYEITGPGLGLDGLGLVLEGMSSLGAFNYQSFLDMDKVVRQKLFPYISQHRDTLKPVPLAVGLTKPIGLDPVIGGRSVYYAMRRIADNISLEEAYRRMPDDADRNLVATVYKELSPTAGPADRPGDLAERRAEAWLKV